MIVTHLTISNTLFNVNIPRIILMVNPINKALTFNKSIYLNTIYKYIDISYIIIDFIKVITAIAVTSTIIFKPFTAI